MDGNPYGYGIVYDEEGRKEYEGYQVNGVKVCFGVEYYSGLNQVKYRGCFFHDMHFGMGVLYDRKGSVEYDSCGSGIDPIQVSTIIVPSIITPRKSTFPTTR